MQQDATTPARPALDGVLATRPPRTPIAPTAHRGRPRRGWWVLALLALVGFVLGSAVVLLVQSPRAAAPVSDQALRPSLDEPLAIWSAWQAGRAQAFAHGSASELRSLYLGRAGDNDVALLRAYSARGLRVTGLTEQVLSLRVRRRLDDRLALLLVSRLASAVAIGPEGRVRLPTSQPRRRLIQLRESAGRWRVASVSAWPRR